ncbi:MAG TPA: selenocysteine-specific translation elongation factor [Candidatus Desulfobacillus denitrificans]|nr:selenocysteine-specific translation elongation factor [Candidatus Desulfobacillus denitrificans]
MIIGTAGHIDHGKSTLVKALTGVDCDRLKEEKARGITLDLGYAYADEGRLGFVDVPGHERLVHNMLAGATGIDFVLLVVAADDGPMPQTREHLAIVDLLDLRRGAVALTKVDAVAPERRAAARAEVAALLAGTALEGAPVFEVSATQGEGVAALHDHLLSEPGRLAARAAAGGFRHAIDRCFTLQGVGLVVTGTAFSGRIAVGDAVTITPPGLAARVRGIHAQDRSAQSGRAGERLALNLAGDFGKEDVSRGMWVVGPALHAPISRFHARLRVPAAAEAPVRHWMPVHVHLGAADILGRVALLEGEALAPGEAMLAEVILEKPAGALWGDHFILRDASATRTLGGGRVLDIFPPTRHKRAPERLDFLRLLEQPDPAPALAHALARQPAGTRLDRYALNRNLAADEAQALWRGMGLVVVYEADGRSGFSQENWLALRARLLEAARAEHERAPDMIGVERDRLRRLTLPTLSRAAFDRLTFELLDSGELAQSGSWLHLPGHRAALAATDADLWRTLRPLLEAALYNPPRVRDIAKATGIAEETVRGLMKRVARVGEAYPVAHDHYFSAVAVADLAGRVARLCGRDGTARAAALRDEIGGGRKVAIHILEFFDRVGYTRRVRDEHALRGEGERQWIL